MAAAVYLHNALFGQPSSTRSLTRGDDNGNGGDQSGDTSDSEVEDDEGIVVVPGHNLGQDHDPLANLDLGSSRAPSSGSPFSTTTGPRIQSNTITSYPADLTSHLHALANTPTTPTSPPQVHQAHHPQLQQLHAPRLSTSSQTTLVQSQSPLSASSQPSPTPWSQAQAQSRALYYAQGSFAYQPGVSSPRGSTSASPRGSSSRRRDGDDEERGTRRSLDERQSRGEGVHSLREDDSDFQQQQQQLDLSTDTDTTNNNTAPVHHQQYVYTSARHPIPSSTNPDLRYSADRQRDTTHLHLPPTSSSPPPPPGLPSGTSRTSERRSLTPYPFPPITSSTSPSDNEGNQEREKRKSRSFSRGRPKGRRRDSQHRQQQQEEQFPNHPGEDPAAAGAPGTGNRNSTTANSTTLNPSGSRRRRHYLPPYLRKGRIPNQALTRPTRILILLVRLFVAVVLCGWAAFSCAKYWLAYSAFRPPGSPAENTVEDPPRSQYAFVLAITCTIATALLVLDSSYFLYFVLYPHDGRLLIRIPTIAPISRANDEQAAPDDVADDTDPSSPSPPAARPRPRAPVQLQGDKFTSMPYRSSVLSTSSGFKRSRRLSKLRPDSFVATYPPVGREFDPASGEEHAVREQAVVVDTDDNEDTNTRPSRSQEQDRAGPALPQEYQENLIPPPPSRYVGAVSSAAPGDESDPQVEKQFKRTYTLHLPSLCHEPSISPLPFPPTRITPAQRYSTQHNDQPRRPSRKWRRTRVFLHIVHWLAFVALNIPGFVNVGLVPVWYQPTQATDVTGVNSPHRLSGLCEYSPDVLWAGTALPPSRPPPCAQTVSYRIWLWGAIGRVLVTFALSLLWVIMDGMWWGAWVVGTRKIGWQGALGRPWKPRRAPRAEQQQEPEDDSEALPGGDAKATSWAKRIRLLSGASKASGRSGRSGKSNKSNKEKVGELGTSAPSVERGSVVAPAAAVAVAIGAAAIGVDPQDALSSPTSKHKVRRKPVNPITPSSPSSNSPPTATYSLNSPPLSSTYGPGGKASYFDQPRPSGGIGSRRPSTHDSIGGSTIVGSPPGVTYLPGSPPFTPASPPASSSYHGPGSAEEHTSFGNAGRRSMVLEIVPELEPRSSDERDSPPEEESPEFERRYPDRPKSRLARYDDAATFGSQYRDRPGTHSPPLPTSPTYPPSPTRPGWAADPNAFSPITSPNADVPLLGRGYFMVGDGGFSAGNVNNGAYDEDSYYRGMPTTAERSPPASHQHSGLSRATSPNSERSNSPNSYGHGQYAGVDVHVETPANGGDDEYSAEVPRLVPATQGQWYTPSTSQQPMAYQHPLAQGIQLAMGHSPESEREVRMLGSVVRRMSTIESFGSHERELSRRGSAATARTTQTGRGNGGGTAQREATNGSGNGAPMNTLPGSNGSGSGDRGGSGSGGQMDRNPEAEASVGFVRATSPSDMSSI